MSKRWMKRQLLGRRRNRPGYTLKDGSCCLTIGIHRTLTNGRLFNNPFFHYLDGCDSNVMPEIQIS